MEEYKELLTEYDNALRLLDEYDHQSLTMKHSVKSVEILDYTEAKEFISYMRFNDDSNVFGLEKEEGKLGGILASIEQTAFGSEVYNSASEKAANLLYFLVKDHPFADGCKRIAAGLFLLYLKKNNIHKNISNESVALLTILVAESRPEEKDIIIKLITNIL